MHRHRQRRRAAAERATRRHKIGAGIGDVGQLQSSSDVAQHPQRVGQHLSLEVQCQLDNRSQCVGCRTKHRDQPRSVALRAGQCNAPHARRRICHGIERPQGRKRHTWTYRTAKPGVQRYAVGTTHRIQPVELGPADGLAFRSAQRKRAERRPLAHGLRDRCVRSRNRWQPPCHPDWWWTAPDRRSASRLPRGSPSPSTSRRGHRPAIPGW